MIYPEVRDYPVNADTNDDGSVDASDIARADRIAYLASGDFASMTQPGTNAPLALLVYGQDNAVALLPASPSTEEMNELVLTRWPTLYVGDGTGLGGDVGNASFADILSDWAGTAWDLDPTTGWARPDVSPGVALYTQMLDHVISFRIVRYYMAGATNPVEYDTVDWPAGTDIAFGPANEKPAWIEFEVVLRDRNNRLAEGFTATHRVNLPSR